MFDESTKILLKNHFQQVYDAMDREEFADTSFASITQDTMTDEQIFDIISRRNRRN